jgi:large subunit ribosomal protein L15
MAGMGKHKRTYIAAYEPDYFGKHGFANPTRKKVSVIHLYAINREALLGKLEKKEGKFHRIFDGKVLSTGKVTLPLLIEATAWSKRVEEKLKHAGGEISKLKGS